MQELGKYLIYSGISTTLFLVLLLIKDWKGNKKKQLLSFILLGFLIVFLTYSSFHIENDELRYVISPVGFIISFALGPLILYYITVIYGAKVELKHMIPFVISILLVSIPSYFFTNKYLLFDAFMAVITVIGLIHFLYYLYISSRLIARFQKLVKNNYSYLNENDLNWLSIWIRGFVLFLILDLLCGISLTVFPGFPEVIIVNIIYLTILIWYIGYYGLNQASVFLMNSSPLIEKEVVIKVESELKVAAYDCKSIELINLKVSLEKLFFEKQIFKNETLSLKEAADLLSISDKKLSYILNECLQSNFYKYVNTYRINYFKNRVELGDATVHTLLSIAYDSGFNSKATFNRVFKQKEGITPLQFKKNIDKQRLNSSIETTKVL